MDSTNVFILIAGITTIAVFVILFDGINDMKRELNLLTDQNNDMRDKNAHWEEMLYKTLLASRGKTFFAAYAFPVGEERKAINEKFDELFEQIKDMGIFHRCETTPEPIQQPAPAIAEEPVPEPETEVAKAAPDSVQDQDSADETSAISDALTEHSEIVVRFLNCSAVATVTPKVMTMAQKREWNTAVFQVFKEPSQEHATELSTLREKIIGRNIPAYNLRQITAAAATMKAPAPVTALPKPADIMQQTNVTVHQISFDELIRVAR